MSKPHQVGWYWFLPDANCPTPTGLLRLDKPVVVLVGQDKATHDGYRHFVVRFQSAVLPVENMSGDWEAIPEPKRMQREAMRRVTEKLTKPK